MAPRFPTKFMPEQMQKWLRIGTDSPYYKLLGMEILSAQDGEGVVRMPMREALLQPAQNVHGGAIASLVDSAVACAILPALGAGFEVTTIEMKLNFLRPMRGDVVCRARAVHIGKSIAVGEATVTHMERANGEDPIAVGIATFAVRTRSKGERTQPKSA